MPDQGLGMALRVRGDGVGVVGRRILSLRQ